MYNTIQLDLALRRCIPILISAKQYTCCVHTLPYNSDNNILLL